MGRTNRMVKKDSAARKRKTIRELQELEEKVLLFSSLAHILDAIIDGQNLTEDEQAESDSVRILGKLVNKVAYLQQSALGILGQALPIPDSPGGQDDSGDGGDSVPTE